MSLNPQAEELNTVIERENKSVYSLLSSRGKAIFFPKKGILAQTAEAKGKKIDATIGIATLDDSTPMRLSCIEKHIALPPETVFPYAPGFGVKALREKWKSMISQKNPSLTGSVSLPVVTQALTHGLSMAGYLFVDEGDSIIMPDLFWGNYNLILRNGYGANFTLFSTFTSKGFNVDGLKEAVTNSKSKTIVFLNFPNNPTGYTPTKEEATEIVSLLRDAASSKEILVVLDDAYFGLVYEEGVETESLFSKLCDCHPNLLAIKIDGATKEDYVWGFRVGFMTFGVKNGSSALYEALETKLAGAVRGNISNASHLSQSLLLHAYDSPEYARQKKEQYETLQERYEIVRKVLGSHPEYEDYFEPLPFNSGYFMCVALNSLDAEMVRKKLLSDYDTGVIALGGIIRIAYSAVTKSKIADLFENLYKACKEVKG